MGRLRQVPYSPFNTRAIVMRENLETVGRHCQAKYTRFRPDMRTIRICQVHLDAATRERLEEQSGLLLRIYEEEFAKDPASQATRNSRSNMIALRHSINQVYGEAVGIL